VAHTCNDVITAIEVAFPGRDLAQRLAIVDPCGREPRELEAPRVRMAIVELSEGDEQRLRWLVQVAKLDYRDVLACKQLGPVAPAAGEQLQRQARAVIDKGGRRWPDAADRGKPAFRPIELRRRLRSCRRARDCLAR
jgi:hypothetical protein